MITDAPINIKKLSSAEKLIRVMNAWAEVKDQALKYT